MCRYCAPDPEEDFGEGYEGKQVVVENLRQLCVHRVANESGRPWAWWDFAMDYKLRCSMKEKKYSKACAEEVVASLGLSLEKVLISAAPIQSALSFFSFFLLFSSLYIFVIIINYFTFS